MLKLKLFLLLISYNLTLISYCKTYNLQNFPAGLVAYLINKSLSETSPSEAGANNICQTLVFTFSELSLNKYYNLDSNLINSNTIWTQVLFLSTFIDNIKDLSNFTSFSDREIPTEDLLNPLNILKIFRFTPNSICTILESESGNEFSYKTNEILLSKLVRPHQDYFIIIVPNYIVLEEIDSTQAFQDIRFKYGIITNNESSDINIENFCSPLEKLSFLNSRACSALINGKHFRVTSVASPSMVRFQYNKDGRVKSGAGAYYEVFKDASFRYNFTFDGQIAGFGGAAGFKKDGVWRGAVGEVFSRDMDFAICAGITMQRHQVVDATSTLNFITRVFYVKKPLLRSGSWETIFKPLQFNVWMSSLVTLITILPIYYFGIKFYYVVNPHCEVPQEHFNKIILNLFQVALEQGLSARKFKGTSTKLLIMLWILFSIVIGTAYKGNLVSFLSFLEKEKIPRTHQELSLSDYKLLFRYYGGAAYLALINSPDPMHKRIAQKSSLVNSSADCIIQTILHGKTACLDIQINGQFAIASNGTLNSKYGTNNGGGTLVRSIDTDYSFSVVWAFRKYSPLIESFDKIILLSLASGQLDYWFHQDRVQARIAGAKWLKSQYNSGVKKNIEMMQDTDNGPRPINLSSLFGAFIIIMLGAVIALFFFIIEILVFLLYKLKKYYLKMHS